MEHNRKRCRLEKFKEKPNLTDSSFSDSDVLSEKEFAADVGYGPLPEYIDKATTGPPHNPVFTVLCKYGGIEEEAKGSTKKEAKNLAAKQMFEKVSSKSKTETLLEKSPKAADNYIGSLQEFAAARRKTLPEYINKTVTGPPHNPVFTVVCIYEGIEEEAKAGTKKEAKNLAAKQMFEKISSPQKAKTLFNNSTLAPINYIGELQEFAAAVDRGTAPEYVDKVTLGPIHNPVFTKLYKYEEIKEEETEGSTNEEAKNIAVKQITEEASSQKKTETLLNKSPIAPINYIGKLQEFAAGHSALPEYINKVTTGPPHNPVFTVLCKYDGMEVEAKSSTKKEAKNLAAKQMFEKISSPIKNENFNIYEDNLQDNQTDVLISATQALQAYERLSMTSEVKLCSTKEYRSINEYHSFLKNSFSYSDRDKIVGILKDIMDYYEYGNTLTILETMLKIPNIIIAKVPHNVSADCIVYRCQLNTNPPICEIGYGKTETEAKKSAISSMIKTLILMLKD